MAEEDELGAQERAGADAADDRGHAALGVAVENRLRPVRLRGGR